MGLSIVLLAAGQGKRMKTTKPKPLVELADKPLIQYSLDTKDELIKIIETTNYAKDQELFVRVSVSNEHAEIDLSKKFEAVWVAMGLAGLGGRSG